MSVKNFIAIFSLLVIFLSFFNIFGLITGKVISEGVVNITVSSTAAINFTTDFVNFGSGSVNLGSNNATIDTRGNVAGGNWSSLSEGFVLDNIGNGNISVRLKTQKTAEEFLGGTNPGYNYMVENNEAGSCASEPITFGSWYPTNTTGDGTLICSVFGSNQASNSLSIDIQLVIPSDATVGALTDSFIATGTSV